MNAFSQEINTDPYKMSLEITLVLSQGTQVTSLG